MIQTIIAVLTVYTLSLWLFPVSSASIFYGFSAMVLLLAMIRGQNGRRIPGIVPGFVSMASAVMLLLFFLAKMKLDFPDFVGLFVGFYCGFVLLLRLFLNRIATWIVLGLAVVLIFALESRYYGNSGYTVALRHSIALLTVLASLFAGAVSESIDWALRRIRYGRRTDDFMFMNRFLTKGPMISKSKFRLGSLPRTLSKQPRNGSLSLLMIVPYLMALSISAQEVSAGGANDIERPANAPPMESVPTPNISRGASPSVDSAALKIDRCAREENLAKRINDLLAECEAERDQCISPSLDLQKRLDQSLVERRRLTAENQALRERIERIQAKPCLAEAQNKGASRMSGVSLEPLRRLLTGNASEADLLASGRALQEQGLPNKAASVYRQIALRYDSPKAMRRIGEIHDPRALFPKRHGQMDAPAPGYAVFWYRKARDKGDKTARARLQALIEWARARPSGSALAWEIRQSLGK
uniref:Uncharacterized protein n=1 Tax=Candidatus Kentrum sp. LPFa TaxID=2126335 RepID=A0A450W785_9GAMM|nr:MAG: hypothetical protein BECKLPF1236B_GA0070989_10418 [Candidatus Kentron sp. LPFa]